jgi:ABC-type uncharacterized transport system permease subunit
MNTMHIGRDGVLKLVSVNAQLAYVFRAEIALRLLGVLLQIFLLKVVWMAVYAGRDEVNGLPVTTLISYLTLANLQVWLLFCDIAAIVYERVREGTIASDLARPIDLLPQLVLTQVGRTMGTVPFVILALPVAAVVGGLTAPASLEAASLYLVSLVLAYVISILAALLLGLLVFWTYETHGVVAIYVFVTQFFAGALVPLSFFPDGLRTAAELLPFQTQAYLPLSIYIGRLAGADALRGLGLQAFWIIALYLAARVLWARAIRRVVIQGG